MCGKGEGSLGERDVEDRKDRPVGDRIEMRGQQDSLTRVVCNTFPSRGKSLTPVSRIAMLELSSEMLDCSEFTHPASGFAMSWAPNHCPSQSSSN